MSGSRNNSMQVFAVLGCGPGGLATAAYLASNNHQVRLFGTNESRIAELAHAGVIECQGALDSSVKIQSITSDLGEAVNGADVIIVVLPAQLHRDVATNLAPLLCDGQTVVLSPGRVFGALEFQSTCLQRGMSAQIEVAETQTIPFTCRFLDGCRVQLLAIKEGIKIAAYPAHETDAVLARLNIALPMLSATDDVLATGLNSVGGILHPVPTMLNLGRMQREEDPFRFYHDGISSDLADVLEQLDHERISIGNELDVSMVSVQQWLADVYGSHGDSLYAAIRNTDCYASIAAPRTLEHRYLHEDVPTGLVPLASLANALHIPTPFIDEAINLASLLCKIDFRETGRTLSRLGINGTNDRQALRALLTSG